MCFPISDIPIRPKFQSKEKIDSTIEIQNLNHNTLPNSHYCTSKGCTLTLRDGILATGMALPFESSPVK